jgi:hypothetical protein
MNGYISTTYKSSRPSGWAGCGIKYFIRERDTYPKKKFENVRLPDLTLDGLACKDIIGDE